MGKENNITLLFRDERIYLGKTTLRQIGNPRYIHILIKEKEKQLFIQACEKDKDAFIISIQNAKCSICSKLLLKYLAHVVGVPFPSDSLSYNGLLLEDQKTVFVDLKKCTVVEYKGEYKDMTYHERDY